jgi:hypothetical protein
LVAKGRETWAQFKLLFVQSASFLLLSTKAFAIILEAWSTDSTMLVSKTFHSKKKILTKLNQEKNFDFLN